MIDDPSLCEHARTDARVRTHTQTEKNTRTIVLYHNFDDVSCSLFDVPSALFFFVTLQILRRADKNGKDLPPDTHTHTTGLMFENRRTFSMKFCSWLFAGDTRSVSMETDHAHQSAHSEAPAQNLKWLLVMLCQEGLIAGGPDEMYCFPSAVLCFIKTIKKKKTHRSY